MQVFRWILFHIKDSPFEGFNKNSLMIVKIVGSDLVLVTNCSLSDKIETLDFNFKNILANLLFKC